MYLSLVLTAVPLLCTFFQRFILSTLPKNTLVYIVSRFSGPPKNANCLSAPFSTSHTPHFSVLYNRISFGSQQFHSTNLIFTKFIQQSKHPPPRSFRPSNNQIKCHICRQNKNVVVLLHINCLLSHIIAACVYLYVYSTCARAVTVCKY